MAIEVKWTIYSIEDISNIAEFISKDSIQYARVQTERFFERAEILNSFAEAGRLVPEIDLPNIRELIEGNYRIIFWVISDTRIDILTVHHSSRALQNNLFLNR